MRSASGGALSLVLEKNLWDWASQIARDHGEDFIRVCASLVSEVIGGTLVTTPPLAEGSRQYLRDTDAVGKIRGRRRLWVTDDPQYPSYWLTRIIIGKAEIDRWLSERGAAPKPSETRHSEAASIGSPRRPLLSPDGRRRPIPNQTLVEHLQKVKMEGGPIPAADKLFLKVRAAFGNYHVTRQDVRTVHKQVWGTLLSGPRSKSRK
jgi:hypothetical protein